MDRMVKASAFGVILCGVVFGFVVGSRIDQSTITLLSGTLVGVLVATPCVAAITWLTVRRRDDDWRARERYMRQSAPLPPEPPQYWVVQGQPMTADARAARLSAPMGWPGQYGDTAGFMPRPRRKFYVIGENGEPREVEDAANPALSAGRYDDMDDAPPVF
jgi:hypothetical protein